MFLYFDPGVKQTLATKKKKWIFLLLIPISIFKVFISCVLGGYILLILTNYYPRRDNLELRNFYD